MKYDGLTIQPAPIAKALVAAVGAAALMAVDMRS